MSRPAQFRMPIGRMPALEASLSDSFVAVVPGARWDTKRWPIERYTQLVRQLIGEGRQVVLLGSPDEKALCDQIEREVAGGMRVMNLAGRTALGEMIAVLAHATLVIGNDSGPLHVAVALGRRTLGIYGPTDPSFVGPHGQLDQVIRHDVPCFPCRNRECWHHSCMNGVPVELVWEKTRKVLSTER